LPRYFPGDGRNRIIDLRLTVPFQDTHVARRGSGDQRNSDIVCRLERSDLRGQNEDEWLQPVFELGVCPESEAMARCL